MAGSNSAGEKPPEPGAAPVEQMTDNTEKMTTERNEKQPVSSDNAARVQNKNTLVATSPARGGTPGNQHSTKKGAVLDRSLQKRIGSALRESFLDIEKEALPEHLQALIKALQAKEQSRR